MATVLAGLATEDVARLVAERDRAEEAARAMRGTEALLCAQVNTLTAERDKACADLEAMIAAQTTRGFGVITLAEIEAAHPEPVTDVKALLRERNVFEWQARILSRSVNEIANGRDAARALLREMTAVVEQYEANINPESVCASVGGLLARARALLAEAGIGDGAA